MAKKKNEELKTLAQQYAELDAEEKVLKAKKDELKVKIKGAMADAGADKIETNFGSFTTYKTTTWKYSPAVAALQQEEQEKGIAEKKETESFRFTPLKEK